jgi:hypothetical protein
MITLTALRRLTVKQFGAEFLFFLLLLPGCKSAPVVDPSSAVERPAEPSPFLLSMPTERGLSFIGVTGIRSDPKETIRLALEDAARRVAVFHKVSGEFFNEINIGSGAFDYTHNVYTTLDYDDEGYKDFVDVLQYNADTDSIEMENTFIIRVTYPAALPAPVPYHPVYSGRNKKPDWVDNPPLYIGVYEVGVGYAGRHSSTADTFNASYKNAVFSIIRNLNVTSQAGDLNYQAFGTFDYETSSDNILYARSSLVNFYALDTWIDPKSKAVWTLAIARKFE